MRELWIVAVVLLAAGPGAQLPALTPGETAMLVNRTDDQYRPTLQRAIADPDAVVRAVAARVAAVRRQADMIQALEAAAQAETDANAREELVRALRLIRDPAGGAVAAAADAVGTLPQIAPGVLASVMAAHRCKPSAYGSYGIARLVFDAAGASRIELDPSQLPRECRPVLATLARLVTADIVPASPGSTVYGLLPIDAEFVTCSSEPAARMVERAAGLKKIRDVKPQYPSGALRDRSQGTVLLRAVVTASGCVREVRVTSGLDPRLDLAALRAVAAWRFEPMIVEGKPVQFPLLCTVSFNVR